MGNNPEYYTPLQTISVEAEVKKSKFIATITHVTSKEEFLSFSQNIKAQYPNANHNCFAYIIGDPQSPEHIGSSDDGEPAGTAGKPLLTVLQQNNLGNVVVMVTRFFGGIKLGTGGLVRAYSTAAKEAVERVSVKKIVQTKHLQASFPFQFESGIRHLLATMEIPIIDSNYSEDVSLEMEVPMNCLDDLRSRLNDTTKGKIKVELY
jgi:uncharacterized YigZ family protein